MPEPQPLPVDAVCPCGEDHEPVSYALYGLEAIS